ncbi:unnamed protein product [Macrosiphum euphorbiae]|uniref:HAT C-terminal dimerisation domain-containing protein n=1 Tax=Macrosiphum euphorbiae TaxID=13131 RepID=A0AAV0WNK9_9HEMI|nr:unnamed protein product [Macrosiphum euphorbiae]
MIQKVSASLQSSNLDLLSAVSLVKSLREHLNKMIRGIDERFSQETLNLIASMGKMLKLQTDDADIKILSEAFNLKNIHTEIKLLINIPEIESICGSSNINISKWLDWLVDSGRSEIFSDFYKSLKLFVTIPVTSCSCERAFSKLTIVKSKLRSVMTQERLNALMLIFIEQHIATEIDLEDVIEEFKVLIPGKRRIEL